MYLKIKKLEKIKDQFGFYIGIKMIGLYDDSGKWIRWVKLNEELIEFLKKQQIIIKDE